MIRVKEVQNPHYITQDFEEVNTKKVPKAILKWLSTNWGIQECSHAMIATENGKVVAVFRYNVNHYEDYGEVEIVAAGTVVINKYRGKGLAQRLWKAAINKHQPNFIQAKTTTKGGTKLIQSLQRQFPDIHWDCSDAYNVKVQLNKTLLDE